MAYADGLGNIQTDIKTKLTNNEQNDRSGNHIHKDLINSGTYITLAGVSSFQEKCLDLEIAKPHGNVSRCLEIPHQTNKGRNIPALAQWIEENYVVLSIILTTLLGTGCALAGKRRIGQPGNILRQAIVVITLLPGILARPPLPLSRENENIYHFIKMDTKGYEKMELYEDVVTTAILIMTFVITGITVRILRKMAGILSMRNEALKNEEISNDLQIEEVEQSSTYLPPSRRR